MSYKLGIYGPATKEVTELLSKLNFDAIFTEPKEDYIKNAHNVGLKAYACIWVFRSPRDDPNLGVENVLGKNSYGPTQVAPTILK